MDIKIIYTIPEGIDPELDKKLEGALAKIGFYWWASGTNMETRERDLAFSDKLNKLIKTEGQKNNCPKGVYNEKL